MKAIELLSGLQTYLELLKTLRDLEKQKDPGQRYSSTVSLSYNTIKLTLTAISESLESERSSSLHLQCTFRIDQQKVFFSQAYCQKPEHEKEITDLIHHHTPTTGRVWNPVVQGDIYDAQIIRYVAIADRIAEKGYLCSSGDNYYPGYFSEIAVTDDAIALKQINRRNARSIDHKNDYHMRDLKFLIPLHPGQGKSPIHDYQIGQMLIVFSNRSSHNNKHCGDMIRKQIEAEELNFA